MDLGLSQREVAARIGADVLSVVNWEKGYTEPELRFLPAILSLLGHDPRPKGATIGERLVRLRTGKGWPQKLAAHELGVDPATLARWERNKRAPTGTYRAKVESFLG
jgi:transcriptional regulator with XRE-family HTH domain